MTGVDPRRISAGPSREPVKVLDGEDAYESRDVSCTRCGKVYRRAPWPVKDASPVHRPRCAVCGSMMTVPLETSL